MLSFGIKRLLRPNFSKFKVSNSKSILFASKYLSISAARFNYITSISRLFSTKNNLANQKNEELFDESEQAAMAGAKQVLKEAEVAVVELKSYSDWVSTVMKSKIPVILDGYADWCNPCKKLTPILEAKTVESNGQFKLVKVNIDSLPEIANGLSVRSIPAVFLVSGGNVMDSFVGVPTDERLEDFINTAKLLDNLSHDEKTIDNVILAGEEHAKNDDYNTAVEVFKQALKASKFNEAQSSRLFLNIAIGYANLNEAILAKENYLKWENQHKHDTHDKEIQELLTKYENSMQELKARQGEDLELKKMEEQLEKEPENGQIMYDIAEHLVSQEQYEEAINYCLDLIAIDRNWSSSASQKLLLDIFAKLGTNNELVKQARKRLTKVLF